jgi:hypothetical protein
MTPDPWDQLHHAIETVAITLDTADPGQPIPIPDGLLAAYLTAYDTNRRPT